MKQIQDCSFQEIHDELIRRGYRMESVPYLSRLTAAQVGILGLSTAADISKAVEISRSAASNRLAEARNWGLIRTKKATGRALVYELAIEPAGDWLQILARSPVLLF